MKHQRRSRWIVISVLSVLSGALVWIWAGGQHTIWGFPFSNSAKNTAESKRQSGLPGDARSSPGDSPSAINYTKPSASLATDTGLPNTRTQRRDLASEFKLGLASDQLARQVAVLRGIWYVCSGFSSGGEIGKQYDDSHALALLANGYPERIPAARDLFSSLNAQCSPITSGFSAQEANARNKALVAAGYAPAQWGKVLKILGRSDRTAEEIEFVTKALEPVEIRPELLAWNRYEFSDILKRSIAPQLSEAERESAVWLATCRLGADCSAAGTVLIRACVYSYLCFGSSIEEGLASTYSVTQLKEISAAANGLIEMLAKGASAFPPKK